MRSSRQVHKRARRRKENCVSNGTKDKEPDVIVIEPSSSDSQQPKLSNSESDDDEEPKTSSNNAVAAAADDDEEEEEGEEDEGEGREIAELKRENHRKKKKKNAAEERENLLHKFPMNRINKIVRSASGNDLRLTHEAVFLINKASEKFLDLFCEEAYDCSVQDHKNYVAYKNLSSIVCKQRRFDFLSDFIPEKLKIEDALEERKAAGT